MTTPAVSTSRSAPRPRRRWFRRLVVLAGVVAVIARVVLWLALPSVLQSVAASHGLKLSVRNIDLSLLSGRVDVWYLTLDPEDPTLRDRADPSDGSDESVEPWLDLEYLTFDLDVSALITGTLRIHRAEIDGLDAQLFRDSHGDWNWARFLPRAQGPPQDEAQEPKRPFTFTSPVAIDSLRLQHVHIHVRDPKNAHPFDQTLDLTVRLSDLGSATRETRFECDADMEGVLDSLQVKATLRADGAHLDAAVELDVVAYHPRALAPYLNIPSMRPVAEEVAATLSIDLALEAKEPEQTFSIVATVRDSSVRADVEEELRIGELTLIAPRVSRVDAMGVTATIDGLYARAQLLDSGWRALGFEWGAETTETDASADGATPFVFELAKLRARDATLEFMDTTTRPPVDLSAQVAYLEGGPLVFGADTAPPPIVLSTSIAARGVADEIQLDGEIEWGADYSTWKARLNARGATLDAIRPYLNAVSVDPTLRDGTLALDGVLSIRSNAPGQTSVEVDLVDLLIADQGQVLAAGEGFMHGFLNDSETSTLTLGDIDLRRVRARVLRREDRSWDWPGFRIAQEPAAAGDGDGEESPDDGGSSRIVFPSVRLRGQELVFTDRTVSPAITLQAAEIDGTLKDLWLGGAPDGGAAAAPASLELRLRADGVCDALTLRASLASREGAFDVDVDAAIRAAGIRDDVLSKYLKPSGIESAIDLAALALDVRAHARQEGDAWVLDAAADGWFDNAGARVFAFQRAEVKELRFGAGPTTAASFEVDEPFAAIERDDRGVLSMGGLRFPPIGDKPADALARASTGRAGELRGSLDEMIVRRSSVAWKDRSVSPAVDTTLSMSGEARGLRVGSPPRPMSFRIDASATGIAEQLLVEGALSPDRTDMTADASVELRGARVAPIAGYLPDTSRVTVQEGHLLAKLSARATSVAPGGHRVEMELREFHFGDARESAPWMSLDSFRVEAPRIDPNAGVYEIGEVSNRGLRMRAVRDLGGVVAMGMRWNAPASADPDPEVSETKNEPTPTPTGTAPPSLPEPPANYPSVTLGPVDIGVDEFRYEDRTTADPTTTIGRLRITTPGVQQVFAADPSALDPMRLSIVAGAEPFVKNLAADIRVSPFDVDPNLKMDLSISGVQGDEWVRAFPDQNGKLDASGWKGAAIAAHVELDIDPRDPRRTPFRIDPNGTFSAGLVVSDVTLRATPDAAPIAGFDALSIQASRVSPMTGDLTVRTVEISHPYASVTVEDDWIQVAGLAVRRRPDGLQESEAEAEAEAASATIAPSTDPPADPSSPAPPTVADAGLPGGPAELPAAGREIRVDALLIEDISLDYRDMSVDPPLLLPFTDIDVQARQLSSNMFKEPRPIRFRVQASAGEIELKKRTGGTNVLFDVLSGAKKVAKGVIGIQKKVPVVKRPAFDSIDVAGRMTFFPEWDGYIKGGVRALELPNFAGVAAEAGITVNDGLLDYRTDMRFDSGRTTIESDTTFTYLGLTEAPNGPISRVLKLTAPLPVVLAVLRDPSGDIRLPTRLSFGPNGLSTRAYLAAITKALSSLITDAVASSPFRVAGTITDVVELLPIPMPEDVTGPPFEVDFSPASTIIDPSIAEEIRSIGRELADDADLLIEVQHSLGSAGIARVGELANPPRELCLELAAVLRHNKADLQAEQRALAAQARAEYGIGRGMAASDTVERLRDLDRQLMITDSALEEALSLLQPGAERKQDQRTRAACLEVARRRLSMISQLLTEAAGPEAMTRVRIRPPRFVIDAGSGRSHVTITQRRARP